MYASAQIETPQNSLITAHLSMAKRMARKMARRFPHTVSMEDVESAAVLGLTEAASRYDETRDEPFMAFAAKRVRGAIFDHLRTHDVLTRRGRRAARRVADATRVLEAEHGRAVTDSEVAEKMGVTDAEFERKYARARDVTMVALDDLQITPLGATSGTPLEVSERQKLRAALARAMDVLEPRELMILICYYRQGLTLKRIGEVLGITESRVCQIHARALDALREQLV